MSDEALKSAFEEWWERRGWNATAQEVFAAGVDWQREQDAQIAKKQQALYESDTSYPDNCLNSMSTAAELIASLIMGGRAL